RQLEPAVAVRRAHHRDLDLLVAEAGDPPCPFSFDHRLPLQLEAELAEELDRRFEVSTTMPTLSMRFTAIGRNLADDGRLRDLEVDAGVGELKRGLAAPRQGDVDGVGRVDRQAAEHVPAADLVPAGVAAIDVDRDPLDPAGG